MVLSIMVVIRAFCHKIGDLEYGLEQNCVSIVHMTNANCYISKTTNWFMIRNVAKSTKKNRTPKTNNITQGDYILIVKYLFKIEASC